jgi:hypothetical protein
MAALSAWFQPATVDITGLSPASVNNLPPCRGCRGRRILAAAGALVLVVGLLCSASAEVERADLALVLALDASGSVDAEEWRLQVEGYAAAFRHRAVHDALAAAGPSRAIVVTVVQWSGYAIQARPIDWTRLDGPAAAQALAERIATMPRLIFGGGTSLSGIIDYAVPLLAEPRFAQVRRVLDVSGDGANRSGRPAAAARDEAVARGIVINGLPIFGAEPELDIWYRDNVIGGPGAFLVVAEDYHSFRQAILAKLIREIAAPDGDWPRRRAQRRAAARHWLAIGYRYRLTRRPASGGSLDLTRIGNRVTISH